MTVFDRYLQQLEHELDIPYPRRRDLLDEVSAHLSELFSEFQAAGLNDADASARAIAAMSLDPAVLESLSEIHRTALTNALSRLPRSVSLGVEFCAIGLVGSFLVFTALKEARMISFISSGGFFMIPINLAGGAILFLGLERIYSLFIKKDHRADNLSKRLLSLKFLAIACALTGIVGTLVGFYEAFAAAQTIAERLDGVFPIFDVAKIAMTTSIWGITLSLVAVTFQFVIEAKTSRIRDLQI